MNEDNDVDISDVMRQRTSREEVRRRNREIMERANAELRSSKTGPHDSGAVTVGKEYSRFGLIRQSRQGSQTFWMPYEFHSSMPELIFGPVKVDLDVDPSKFAEFNRDSIKSLFADCLKTTCLVDPASITYLDLVNPEEAFKPSSRGLDPQDEALMTNELKIAQTDVQAADGVYTGHFLRKPQLMSNDLFTEGNRNVGASNTKFTIPRGANQAIDGEYDAVKALDGQESMINPVTKTKMGVKRILSVFPDQSTAALGQFKFDDRSVDASAFYSVLDKDMGLFENVAMSVDGSEGLNFPKSYTKRRRYIQTNKASSKGVHDEYYLLSVPDKSENHAFLKPVGSKCILKRDNIGNSGEVSLKLVTESQVIDS